MSDQKYLFESYPWAAWEKKDYRFQRLTTLDLFLNNKAYDHLKYPFKQEEDSQGNFISMYDRRPSATFNIAGMVAKITSRKLFAGRHAPALTHKDANLLDRVKRLVEECKLEATMPNVARMGSVGSAVVTFKIVGEEGEGRAIADTWPSRFCRPKFDKYKELKELRICYPAPGYEFLAKGFERDNKNEEIEPTKRYWRVTDLTTSEEITYLPVLEVLFDPNDPSTKDQLVRDEKNCITHDIGIVQAQWFQNLSGGAAPDGACTWEDAIPLIITTDYQLSQLVRGVNYSACPQVVTIGEMLKDANANTAASPHIMLMFPAPYKDGEATIGGGDAKLLEMTGEGIKVALELAKVLRKLALEQIGATRKDPDEVSGLITGKAMELLDEDFIDLMQELRTCYGYFGFLQLVKKIVTVAIKAGHPLVAGLNPLDVDGLTLVWPRTFTPTPQESLQLVQAMSQGVGGTNAQGVATPQIIDPDDARDYLYSQIDFPIRSENRNIHGEQMDDESKEQKEDQPPNPDEINPPAAA